MPSYTPPSSGGGGGAPSGSAGGELAGTYPNPTVADAVIDDANVVVGGLTNAALATAAAIANTKLATNPLARANHTGTQAMATISDAGALATLSAVASAQITDGTIVGGDLSSSIALPSGATATTQSAGDTTTKLASTAYAVNQVETADPFGEVPADVSMLEWNMPVSMPNGNSDMVKGFIWVVGFNVRRSRTVTNLLIRIGAAGTSLSNCFLSCFDSTGTRVGSTAVDQSTSWQTAGAKTIAIPGGAVTMPAGFYYMCGLVGNGSTTACTFVTFLSSGTAAVNHYRTFANAKVALVSNANNGSATSAATAMPTSITIGANGIVGLTSYTNTIPWVGIS